jgi:hypothetical protein
MPETLRHAPSTYDRRGRWWLRHPNVPTMSCPCEGWEVVAQALTMTTVVVVVASEWSAVEMTPLLNNPVMQVVLLVAMSDVGVRRGLGGG